MSFIRKSIKLIILSILTALCLTGCDLNQGNQVGACPLNVVFISVPQEFYQLDESVRNDFYIVVVVENLVTEKKYTIILNEDNEYKYTANLNPGNYRVVSIMQSMGDYTGMELASDKESFTLDRDSIVSLSISVSNLEEFITLQSNINNGSTMAYLNMFSRNIMIDGTIYNMLDLTNVLSLNVTNPEVKAYEQAEYTDEKRGITVTYLNDSGENKNYTECRIIAVKVFKRSAVFPGNIAVGSSGESVCNATTGVYGEPYQFTGSAFLGYGLGDTGCVYQDALSGDKVTVYISDVGKYVSSIEYEIECY